MKVISGIVLRGDGRRNVRGGEIEFAHFEFKADDGRVFTWKRLTMSREVSEVLWLDLPTKLYMSPRLCHVFGARTSDGEAVFKSYWSHPLVLVGSIVMILAGLGGSGFMFPILIALAGVMGVIMYAQAVSAKRRYRRDGRTLEVTSHA